jgi:hypothetical protein
MPIAVTSVTEPDGTIVLEQTDVSSGELRQRLPLRSEVQSVKVRRLQELKLAMDFANDAWNFHANLVAGGATEWAFYAADTGLPNTGAALTAATDAALTARRKTMARAVAALNRYRLA